jgi:hypothetical protein
MEIYGKQRCQVMWDADSLLKIQPQKAENLIPKFEFYIHRGACLG